MDELEKQIVILFKEEHQDWVTQLSEAEKKDGAVDVNLGGKFAGRLERLLAAFREFKERNPATAVKKKGFKLF